MIGIDTNILVRHFVRDDLEQADAATAFLIRDCTTDRPGFISLIVLCEFVWVLTRLYKLPPADIFAAIETLLQTSTARLEAPDLVRRTIERTRATGGDFADILILGVNREAGCSETVTFDRRLAAMPGVRALEP